MKLIISILIVLQFPFAMAQTNFNDESLKGLLKESDAGIIFIWSPLMPLSVRALGEVTEIADRHNFDLKILIDSHPLINFEPMDIIADSSILTEIGMMNHFPSIILYKNGGFLPWMIQGYEDKNSLKELIMKKLGNP